MHRSLRRSLAVLAVLALPAAPAVAGAQAGTTPFRAGQWGAEFSATNSINLLGLDETDDLQFAFPSVGFLKFRSPTAAWLVDVSASFQSLSAEVDGEEVGDSDGFGLGLRLGSRSYRSLSARTLGFTSFGGQASFGSIDDDGDETSTRGLGVFGELGGAYMVTSNLSLGASFGGALDYVSRTQENPFGPEVETSGVRLRVGQTRLLVTLFF